MSPLCIFEMSGNELLDIKPEASRLIDKVGWANFFRRFNGNNTKVTYRFTLSLKENVAHIGDLSLIIFEGFIAKEAQLPQTEKNGSKEGK